MLVRSGRRHPVACGHLVRVIGFEARLKFLESAGFRFERLRFSVGLQV